MKLSNCHSGFLTGAPGPLKVAKPVREYDWGSTGALATLEGREPSGRPEAELWMGAHPAASSRLRQPDGSEVSLAAAIHTNPVAVLGRECTTRFSARLPFLRKVLAIARALSIQVHPSRAQAAAGFAREQAAGMSQAERSYVDLYAKPEMLLPVTEFAALAGLRPRDRIIQMLASLNVPALRPVLLTLESEAVQAGPAGVLAILATWPRAQRRALASLICERAHGLLGGTATSLDPDGQSSLEWVITLAEQHPDDPLVVAPLLLRLHRLQPGQPIYLPNGVPHACLSGVGVEIMASRGQVYRASVGRALPASPQRHSPEPERSAALLLASSVRMPKAVSSRTATKVRLTITEEDEMCTHTPRCPGGQAVQELTWAAAAGAHLNATGAAPSSPLQTPEPYSLPMPDKPLEAIMLVGGQGTRLRPLTLSAPKPLLPTAGAPFLAHLLAWAAAGGVTHVVLATCYKAEMFAAAFGDGSAFGLSIDYVSEDVPLDTAGAIRNAANSLRGTGAADPVVVLNSDILSGHDLSAQIDLHVKADAAVTLHLVEVDDPSRFGAVPTDGTGRVMAFLEKTPNPVTDRINAGCYVFRRDVIGQIPAGRRVSVERDTFPGLIEAGELVMGYHESAYWLDVGTPQTFVRGSCDLVLGRLAASAVPGPPGDMLLLAGASVEPDASVSGGSVVGVGASVGSGATVYGSVLFDSATVGDGAVVRGSIVGRGAVVAPGAVLDDAVVGDGAYVGPGNELARGVRVWPGVRLEPTSVRFSSDV